jgi:glycerol-3-phosphate dehydrogenase subunit B
VLGAEVVSCERDGDRVVSVSTRVAGHDGRVGRYSADWFVLASGGFQSGAIELDSRWVTRDRVLGLPLAGVPVASEPRFVGTYLAEQPMARVGVAVDADLHAHDVANVLVAGAALPGAVPWREGSGEGIALASGYRAAQAIAASAGLHAEAAA